MKKNPYWIIPLIPFLAVLSRLSSRRRSVRWLYGDCDGHSMKEAWMAGIKRVRALVGYRWRQLERVGSEESARDRHSSEICWEDLIMVRIRPLDRVAIQRSRNGCCKGQRSELF
ncbi:hypothetical protein V6N13_033043 [Hibiscus sabdariffa]